MKKLRRSGNSSGLWYEGGGPELSKAGDAVWSSETRVSLTLSLADICPRDAAQIELSEVCNDPPITDGHPQGKNPAAWIILRVIYTE